MPRRRFNTSRSFQRSRRESQWLSIPPVRATLVSASTATLALSLTTEEKALRPFTIVRTRMLFQIASDQQIASENYGCALGIAVVSDQAEAIGITAIPTPDTDRNSDLWLLYEDLVAKFTFGDATGFVNDGQMKYVDSKAMRKVEEGNDVTISLEAHANSQGLLAFIAGRLLVKLH